jgi:hypothetical protein
LNKDSRSFWFTFPALCYRWWVGSWLWLTHFSWIWYLYCTESGRFLPENFCQPLCVINIVFIIIILWVYNAVLLCIIRLEPIIFKSKTLNRTRIWLLLFRRFTHS